MAIIPTILTLSLCEWAALLFAISATWLCITVAYRLLGGPLATIPGPKLAAVTGWYETYFECVKRGRYWVEIEKMHERYGPIVRISPGEVHVNDPDWNEPYKVSSRVNKYHWYYKFVGSSDAAFGTSDHDLHRMRRKAQQNYFTLDAVSKFDSTLGNIVSTLIRRVGESQGTGQPVNLSNAFRSFATDVVTEYSFHKSYDLLLQPGFAPAFQKTVREFPEIGLWHRHFGLILNILDLMPRWLTMLINPAGLDVIDFFDDIGVQTKEIVADHENKTSSKSNYNSKYEKENVIHQMLNSPDLPESDKKIARLALEVRTFVGAGTETTGNTLTSIAFYLLANPEKAKRLKEEVTEAHRKKTKPLVYQELLQLPYLNAVILEGLRISTSVAGRLPRINTREAIIYKSYGIPAGTPISTTQKLTHDNPAIFPSPRSFLPERWLVEPAEKKRLEKYLQPFGKGSRSCLGIHLAYSELYVTIAELFRKFDLELYDTTEEDIAQVHDFFSPFPDSDKGLRVIIS